MTYNAWGLKVGPFSIAKDYRKRIYSLPSEIYQINPDVIFLQEIWKKADRNYLIEELFKRGWKYCFYKSDDHPRVAKFKKSFKWINDLILGNGLITFSKFPIVFETAQVKTFSRHTATEEFFTRKGAIFCEILVPQLGKINCINAHLGSIDFQKRKNRFNQEQKLEQLQQIIELNQFIRKTDNGNPLFLGADLNIDDKKDSYKWFSKPSAEYEALTKKLKLVDSFRLQNPIQSGVTFSEENNYKTGESGPEAKLDYLFHQHIENALLPVSSQIIFNRPITKNNEQFYLSDHFGILSEYSILKGDRK